MTQAGRRLCFAGAFLVCTTIFPVATRAAAANTAYATLGYTSATLGARHPTAWSIRGGYYFAPQLAAEIQVLTRGNGDAGRVIESGVGAFLRGEAPVGHRIRVYVLAGYAYTDVITAVGYKLTLSNIAYGAGAEVDLGPRIAASLDYMSYNDNNRVNGVTAGLKLAF